MTTKACLDCKHCRLHENRGYVCRRFVEAAGFLPPERSIYVKHPDGQIGKLNVVQTACHTARTDEHLCGKQGKLWEARV